MSKRLAYICVLAAGGRVTTEIALMLAHAQSLSEHREHPWAYRPLFAKRLRPVARARNSCVMSFLADPRAERLLFVDDDMAPPRNWPQLLEHDAGAVSGLSLGWQPGGPGFPAMLTWEIFRNSEGGRCDYTPPASFHEPFEVDAAGAGCLCLSRSLLERIEPPWFRGDDGPAGQWSCHEDLWFFGRVNALGERCLVDPQVRFGHMKTVDLWDLFEYVRAERRRIKGYDAEEVDPCQAQASGEQPRL